jgi:hypothetical protein
MRQTISGLVAAFAVVVASVAPAMACGGGGLFQSSCSPCGQAYVSPCAQTYVPAPTYSGCNTGCGGAAYERLPDPEQQYAAPVQPQQYYYVNQGPSYTGPGNFAPYPTYQESGVSGWGAYRHRPHYYGAGVDGPRVYGYRTHPHFRSWRTHTGYRYGQRYSLPPRQYYAPHRSLRYGYGTPMSTPRHYGYREHVLRRYN